MKFLAWKTWLNIISATHKKALWQACPRMHKKNQLRYRLDSRAAEALHEESSAFFLSIKKLDRQFLDMRVSRTAVSSTMESWFMPEINAMQGIKQQCTAHADVGDVREMCWWYCRLQCGFNPYLLFPDETTFLPPAWGRMDFYLSCINGVISTF